MMDGYLRVHGIRVQRDAVREALRSVDPEGTANRWRQVIRRRTYSVYGPNALWHMDAHLKIVRYVRMLFI